MTARLEGREVQLLGSTALPDLRQGDALLIEELDEAVLTLEVVAVEHLLEPLLGGDQRGGTHTTGIVEGEHVLLGVLGQHRLVRELVAILGLNDERRSARSTGALDHLLAPSTDSLAIGQGEGLDLGRTIVQSPSGDLHLITIGERPDQGLTPISALVVRIPHGLDERQHLGRDATERVVVQLRHRLGVVHHVLQSSLSKEVDGVIVEHLRRLADQLLDTPRDLLTVLVNDAPVHQRGRVIAEDHGLSNRTTTSAVDHRSARDLGDRLGRHPVAILVLLAEERGESLIGTPSPARLSQLEPEALLGLRTLDVAVVSQTAAAHHCRDPHRTIGGRVKPVDHLALLLLHDHLHLQSTGDHRAELLVRAVPFGEELLTQGSRSGTTLDHLVGDGVALVESSLNDLVDISQDLLVVALADTTLVEKVVTSSTTSLAIRHVDGLSPLEHEADRTSQHIVDTLGGVEPTLLRLVGHGDDVLGLVDLEVRSQVLKDVGVLVPTTVLRQLALDGVEQREHRCLEQLQHGTVQGQLHAGPVVHGLALKRSVDPICRVVQRELVSQEDAICVDHGDLLRAEDLPIQKLALHDGRVQTDSGIGQVVLHHLSGDVLCSPHVSDAVQDQRHDLAVQGGEKPLPTVGNAHLGGQCRHHLLKRGRHWTQPFSQLLLRL